MSHLFPNYARSEIEIVRGEGNRLMDQNEKWYLDFTSGIGVVNLGYSQPKIKAAVEAQLNELWHMPNLYQNHLQEEVAEKLSYGGKYVGFFCNSGAEANEAAIKLARKASGKPEIITFENSFHGRTYGTMSATAQAKIHEGFAPLVPGFQYVPYNDLAAVKKAMNQHTAAVMIELVQGEGGLAVADQTFVKDLAALCKASGVLLVIDEVQTGTGRTGTLFSFEQFGIEPDIYTAAKGLGNGLPVGVMMGKTELKEAFGPGSHGSTFGGNKVVLASSNQVLNIMKAPGFFADVAEKADYLRAQIREHILPHSAATELLGLGLMVGIRVTCDLASLMKKTQGKGLLVLRAGTDVLRLLPPLTITKDEIDEAIKVIESALTEVENEQ